MLLLLKSRKFITFVGTISICLSFLFVFKNKQQHRNDSTSQPITKTSDDQSHENFYNSAPTAANYYPSKWTETVGDLGVVSDRDFPTVDEVTYTFSMFPDTKIGPAVLTKIKLIYCPLPMNYYDLSLYLLCGQALVNGEIHLQLEQTAWTADTAGEKQLKLEKLVEIGGALPADVLEKNCVPKLRKSLWNESSIWYSNDNIWNKLVLFRNPFDRFLDTWSARCIDVDGKALDSSGMTCYSCGSDIKCFLERQHDHFKTIADSGQIYTLSNADYDFFPQSAFCNLKTYGVGYNVLHMDSSERFRTLLRDTFAAIGWNRTVLSGFDQSVSRNGSRDASRSIAIDYFETAVQKNLAVANLLFQNYYSDFHHLKFKLPLFVEHLCDLRQKEQHHTATLAVCSWRTP